MYESSNWLTTVRTVLIMKDKEKGNNDTNFRPITCLFLMWKIFSRKRSERLYAHLEKREWCQMNKKGAEEKLGRAVDQILIEKKRS